MQEIIVTDTSCLILLEKLNILNLLEVLFNNVIITQIVADEYGKNLPDFIRIENPQNIEYQKKLENSLDPGEASVIALAVEKQNCLLIIDDFKGRRIAKQLKVNYTGTIGILIIAEEKGLITSLSAIVKKIKKTNFRIDNKLLNKIKKNKKE